MGKWGLCVFYKIVDECWIVVVCGRVGVLESDVGVNLG